MAVQVKASFKLTGWNGPQLNGRVAVILRKYGSILDQQLKEEIKTSRYDWPRETKRRNRSVVSSPRDIVDLGGFLRSQRIDYGGGYGNTIKWTWDAKSESGFPYVPLILTGYTTKRGTVVPGRNWIKPALEAKPLDAFFAAEWRKLASGGL
jgi:hypothetical protein